MENDRRAVDHWQLKKEVSLGDLIAIFIAIMAVITAYQRLDGRVTEVEITSRVNTAAITATMNELKVEMRELRNDIKRIIGDNGSKK